MSSHPESTPDICRVFPLSGVVLFPQAVLPLHIFEPRYRQMTADALADDRLIAIAQPVPDASTSEDSLAEPELESVGCLGEIFRHEQMPDGRYNFLLVGRHRIRLTSELETDRLYRQVHYEILEDIDPTPTEEQVARDNLISLFRKVVNRASNVDSELLSLLEGNVSLGTLSDIVAQALDLPAILKQSLLAQPVVLERSAQLVALLHKHVSRDQDEDKPTFPPAFSPN